MNNLISVLMPVYNVSLYVEEAVQSILKQTYEEFELIIVDDCSSDDTFSICEKLAAKDKRIKLFKNSVNMRIEKTLNFALSKAEGWYIARMDGDDISALDRLEVMKNYLDNNQDIALVGVNTYTINQNGELLGSAIYPNTQRQVIKTLTLQTPVLHIWMTYKYIYDEMRGYRIFKGSEDYDFILRLITAGYKVTNIPNYYGYSVRINRDNNTVSREGLSKIRSAMYVVKLFKERQKKINDTYTEENLLKYTKCNNISKKLYNLSNVFLYKAMRQRRNKHNLSMMGFVILSLISPYQITYYFKRLKYFCIMKNN